MCPMLELTPLAVAVRVKLFKDKRDSTPFCNALHVGSAVTA